jgi:hypothetical protein
MVILRRCSFAHVVLELEKGGSKGGCITGDVVDV